MVLHDRIHRRLGLTLVLATVGALLIFSQDFSVTAGAGPLLVVVAALASGTYMVASKRLVGKCAILLPLVSSSLIEQAQSLSAVGWSSTSRS